MAKLLKLSRYKCGEKGFTFVEILVALAILTVIMGGLGAITIQIFNTNDLSTNRALAIRQVQNAGQWLSRDMLQATLTPTFSSPNGFPSVVITQDLSSYGGQLVTVTYTITGTDLQRTEQIGVGTPTTTTIATGVTFDSADSSADAPTWFRSIGNAYEFKITSVIGSGNNAATETRTYKIEPRPDHV